MITRDQTKCKCGKCNVYSTDKLIELVNNIDMIYHIDTGKHLAFNCWARCTEHNAAVGGAPGSAHLTGNAVDIQCSTSNERYHLMNILIGYGIKRIGIGKTFMHLDIEDSNPQKVIWLY